MSYLLWNFIPCIALALVLGSLATKLWMSRKMAGLRGDLEALQADLTSREAESLMLSGRLKSYESVVEDAQSARGEARTKLAERERELESLRGQLREATQAGSGRMADLELAHRHALAARDAEAASLIARIRELEPLLDAEKSARSEALAALAEKDIEAAAHANRAASLERQTDRMAEMERALQAQLSAKQSDFEGLTALLDHQQADLHALRMQADARGEEIARLNSFVQALEPLSAQLSEAERNLTKSVEAKNAEIERLTNHSRQLEGALASAIAERDREAAQWRGRVSELEASLRAKETLQAAGSATAADTQEIERLLGRVRELETELRTATASRDAEIAKLRALTVEPAAAPATPSSTPAADSDPIGVQRELSELLAEHRVDFRDGTADLAAASKFALDAVATLLQRHPGLPVEVTSHTDNTGDFWHNYELTRWRAGAVRQYLVDRGIPADRLTSHGCGMTRPVGDNNTPEGRNSNRRVEFRVCTEMLAARGIARNGKL